MQKYSKVKSKQGIISKFRKSATILTSKFGPYKLTKDAADLIAAILYEVNRKLIDSCISSSGKGDTSYKHVVQATKSLLSKEMSKCALATANLKIVSHRSGKLGYKGISEQKSKRAAVKPEIFKKGLIQLASLAHRHYSLSPDVRTIMSIIYKLVAKLSLKAITEIGEKSEMELKDVVSVVRSFLPSDLYSHADNHASENVSRYENDLLDFKIKPLSEEHLSDSPKQSDVLRPGLKSLAQQLQVSFGKDTLGRLEDLVWSACDGLAEKASETAKQEKAKTLSVTHLYNAMKTAFPSKLFHQSCANAEASILNYQCGLLSYEPPTLISRAEVTIEPDMKVVAALNFKNTIRSITQDCQRRLLFGIGCLALLNDILNEIVGSLAEKCIEEANKNQTSHLSEKEALGAINSMFPEEMKRHAFARLLDVHREVTSNFGEIESFVLRQPSRSVPENEIAVHQELPVSQRTNNEDVLHPVTPDISTNADRVQDDVEQNVFANFLDSEQRVPTNLEINPDIQNAANSSGIPELENRIIVQERTDNAAVWQNQDNLSSEEPKSRTTINERKRSEIEESLMEKNVEHSPAIHEEENIEVTESQQVRVPKIIYWTDIRPWEFTNS